MKRFILAATIVAATACGGGDASLSPVGPSRSSAGASISGTVSGTGVTAPRALDGSTFSTLATSSVTVSIVGTNISTTTDGQGQFTLNNVPTGTVTLNFSAPGQSASITLTGIGPDDKVQIAVTLNGNDARVDSEHHSSPNTDTRELEGVVSASTGTCPAVTFTVNTTKVTTNSATVFRNGACADATKNGARVEVEGTRQADGSILATRVELKQAQAQQEAEVEGVVSATTGTCPSLTFMVGTTKVTTNSATTFRDGICTDVKDGARVEVKGTRQADGSILATRVELKRAQAQQEAEVEGVVSGSTGTCPAVTFMVNTTKVTTNSATAFRDGTCADATKNGARVEVKGAKQADGSILATRVEVKQAQAQQEAEVKGAVSGSTGSCPAVTFMVNTTKVTTNSATAFRDGTCADTTKNGARVEVKGTRQTDGSILATRVELDR